jgi:CheY-like chemotaxis protein
LVVDDDPMTRKLMKRMLTRLGCAVSTAENGSIALGLIMGEGTTPLTDSEGSPSGVQPSVIPPEAKREFDGPRYELVFLDNQMPVLSGLEAVSRLRSAGRTDFVVGVTGMFTAFRIHRMSVLTGIFL